MGAPCVNDTCSIVSNIDPVTRRLQLDANLDPTGGLECGTDANPTKGLRINLGNADDCLQNILSINASNELVGTVPSIRQRNFGSAATQVDIPHSGAVSSNVFSTSLTNPFDCQRFAIAFGRFQVQYNIESAAADGDANTVDDTSRNGFNADILVSFERDGTALTAEYYDIGGFADQGEQTDSSNKRRWSYFAIPFSIAAGATHVFTANAMHQTASERDGVITEGASSGFSCIGQISIFPQSVVGI